LPSFGDIPGDDHVEDSGEQGADDIPPFPVYGENEKYKKGP
jgi:hypothetical protein